MSRILIVDDEESIRHALRQVFEYEEHEVSAASDGPDAIELFQSFGPDGLQGNDDDLRISKHRPF